MKIKNAAFFIMTAVILLLTVTCVDPKEPDEKEDDDGVTFGPVHFDALNITGQQVWMPNYDTGKVSKMLLKFEGDRSVDVIVIDYSAAPSYKTAGSGEIKQGILKFKVDEIESNLLDSGDLLYYYFNEWYDDGDIAIEPSDVKGNIISLVTLYKDDSHADPIEAVIREGFSGTNVSLTGEYIYYLYVNKDCTISAKELKKTDLKYTFKKLDISLKAGWNTICKSETYTTTGDSSYSITVSNPSIRWVMQKTK